MSITVIILAAGIILCLALSSFFSGSEMAYSSANTVRLENLREKGDKRAKTALYLCEHFEDALSAILIGNNLVNIAASSMASVLVLLLIGESYAWVSTVAMTLLVIIFGETLPKIICTKTATKTALKNSFVIRTLMIVFAPISIPVVALTKLITKPLKQTAEDNDDETVEELQSIIETAGDEGTFDEDDTLLIKNAIDFSDISASEVMTARVDVMAIDIDDSWEEILKTVETSPYSRIPVYKDSIDNIIGVLHLNNFYKKYLEVNGPFDIREILSKPCFVYKTMKLPVVLEQFKKERQHLAIVTDEYSGTMGVITLEDVLEQLVGEIWDETDTVEYEVVKHTDNEFEIDGNMPIGDFLDLLSIDEDEFECESDTVGGWVVERLEHFPSAGESFEYDELKDKKLTVKIISMDERRVDRVLVVTENKEEEK
ncbi:MAG: hemolysin family protein [Sphaerochaetaceae bacterium]|nr:hemolysin family protein [Sphaerochaetaceae bacterium]